MKFLFVIFLLPLQLFAQDITGVWTGTLYNDTTKQFIKYELAISEYNGKLSGYSHIIFVIDSVENIGVKSIKVKKVGNEFMVEDDKLIYNNYTEPPARRVKKYCDLFLSQSDTTQVLSGSWKTNRTKEYNGLTGRVFLQKKKKIKETLIIAKLENLGLVGSLSFMTSPAQSRDLTIIDKPEYTIAEAEKPADIAKDVASNIEVPANGNQQAGKQSLAGKQISQMGLNKKDTAKEKTQIGSMQLPVADITVQKDKATGMILPGNISLKSTTPPISKQHTPGKEFSGMGLNKDDSDVNKGTINEVTSLKAEKAKSKNEPIGIVSIKSATQQIVKQNKAGEENTGAISNKDSAMNKSIIHEVPLLKTEMPTSKNASENIVSTISATQQINKQQEAIKAIPGMVFKKDGSDSIKTGIKSVNHAAAEIATRKIESIRSVDIKSDSLLLTLYDNGEIDGDTVSVLLNGEVIMPMEGLSLKAINKTIYLTPEMGDSIVLIMYAENLGSIPPNTGLLVIHDGEDVYEIRFTGDLEKNSSIILKRKRKK